ncbi:uncharacterized protein KQ657_003167 [Scheffersomyces spartinae]|uniref:Manganese/iron superoxide dismutase C-terminal domain-containing protein n=1 Tax=Scheffersomyces spartinae TaxID=45513 RepID=A0A9P8AKS8_9ASCO|nr:uncharacterized protein KQ657_003167 [Scheffersomyces spartinae]KAG7195409.1 hypothetical protein KQ657_003167 [Scheffersomyces spartinae]
MFNTSKSIARRTVQSSRRLIHEVPHLKNGKQFAQQGIEGLYTPQGFQTGWTDYQRYLTTNLTLLTNGTENELKTPYQILLNTAKQTTEQHVYHFASQAHNNHFYFDQLADKSEASKTQPSRLFFEKLASLDHSDLNSFRDEFLLAADSMFGQGWVFLVELPDKSLKILRCHNDGTPYYYGKNQSLDLNGGVDEGSFEYLNNIKKLAKNSARDYTLPLLGVSCWDHSYVKDYGLTGKADYLTNFWDCIDWSVINKRIFEV